VVTAQPSQEQFENNLAFAMAIQQGKIPLLHLARWQQHPTAAESAPLTIAGAAGPLTAPLAFLPDEPASASQRQLSLSDALPVWLEDESRSIGKAFLPAPLVARMASPATHLLLMQASQGERVANLCADYAGADPAHLLAATHRLTKKFGHARSGVASAAIGAGRHAEAASVLLQYYDATYSHAMTRKGHRRSAAVALEEPQVGADAAPVEGSTGAAALCVGGSSDPQKRQKFVVAAQRSAAWAVELILAEKRLQLAALSEGTSAAPAHAPGYAPWRAGIAVVHESVPCSAGASAKAISAASWAALAVRTAASTHGITFAVLGAVAQDAQGLPSDRSTIPAAGPGPRVWEAVECH
jgi:hypothetical protein